MNISNKKQLLLISPRGFCAGVTRAIDVVLEALSKYGAPVYVKHEIVHNKHVIEELTVKELFLLRILMTYLMTDL